MPELIERPTRIGSAGNKPKIIDEFFGRVNTRETRLSIAKMQSPGGWVEPGQRPRFDEYTVVLRGILTVKHETGTLEVHAGQALLTRAGEWIQYATPHAEGAEYVAICLPAFSPGTVHRDEQRIASRPRARTRSGSSVGSGAQAPAYGSRARRPALPAPPRSGSRTR